jgi:hypothetical protein
MLCFVRKLTVMIARVAMVLDRRAIFRPPACWTVCLVLGRTVSLLVRIRVLVLLGSRVHQSGGQVLESQHSPKNESQSSSRKTPFRKHDFVRQLFNA